MKSVPSGGSAGSTMRIPSRSGMKSVPSGGSAGSSMRIPSRSGMKSLPSGGSAGQLMASTELSQVYPSADLVGWYTVFNIKGNKYRLIARIVYRSQTLFVVKILTHEEYDLGSSFLCAGAQTDQPLDL